MEYLEIELDTYGFMFSTAPLYFSVSWLGIGIGIVSIIAYKIYKRTRNKKINTIVECNTTSDANIDLWGSNE
jgi:hypothetical protein